MSATMTSLPSGTSPMIEKETLLEKDYPLLWRSIEEIDEEAEGDLSVSDPIERQVAGNHYAGKIQHVEFVEANNIPYLEAQVMKYICRHDQKNGAEDIMKAIHYCQFILKFRYNTTQEELS